MKEQINEMAKHICNYCVETCGECDIEGKPCETAMEEAEALYNAGYRKQKEGEWELVEKEDFYKFCKCSTCGHAHCFGADYELFHFCPNCGSKMKGATDGSKN